MSDEKAWLYADPIDADKLREEFKTLKTRDEVKNFIDRVFPGWLVESTDRYSEDYPHLQKNWEFICGKLGAAPQRIIGVSRIEFDNTCDDDERKEIPRFSFIKEICEEMTKKGYCVRRVGEFTSCPVCERAIPVIEVWHLLKEKGMPVPGKWSDKCKKCR